MMELTDQQWFQAMDLDQAFRATFDVRYGVFGFKELTKLKLDIVKFGAIYNACEDIRSSNSNSVPEYAKARFDSKMQFYVARKNELNQVRKIHKANDCYMTWRARNHIPTFSEQSQLLFLAWVNKRGISN